MAFTGVSLILLATVRFTLDVTYLFIAFIHKDPREARLAFLQDVHVELFISKHAMLVTALLIGDCFMVRPGRCFYTPPLWWSLSVSGIPLLGGVGKEHLGRYFASIVLSSWHR